jgi:predicted component of type VI protein secretion system
MVTLRLFHQTDPFRQLEARDLDEGELAIGRDPSADWTIPDPDMAVSRLHCVIARRDGRLTLRDTSANGVFLGARRDRLPRGEIAAIEAGETLRLGDFLIVVEPPAAALPAEAETDFDAPFHRPMLQPGELDADALATPSDWAIPAPEAAACGPNQGSLLEAFCAGAKLDASAFAGEDPEQVMRRLGAVYQQMVLGLGDLMSERTSVKAEYRLGRTTVRAEGNNPFKWAPPHRVAVDLLRPRDDGFLTGPAAAKASFEDLKKHLLCMLAGTRAAVGATIDSLAPEPLEERARSQSFRMNRTGAAWAEYLKLHADVSREARDNPDSAINRAFRASYERRLQELDAMSTQS